MAAEVIKEFLVSLGYKQDETALRNFSEGINKATNAVIRLSTIITASATLVGVAIERWASGLEDLYYASQRTGMSVNNIKAFQLAVQNLGASGEQALGAVEGITHAMITQGPGIAAILHSWGAQLQGGKLSLQDMVVIARKFREMTPTLAAQYANMLEIPYQVMLAMRSGEFEKNLDRAQKTLKGMNWDKIAADAQKFKGDLRDLGTIFQWFGAQVEDALIKKFHLNFEQIKAWMVTNGPWIARKIVDVVNEIVGAIEKLWPKLKEGWAYFQKLDKETGGWLSTLGALLLLLKITGAGGLITGLLQLAGAFGMLSAAIIPIAAPLLLISGALTGIYAIVQAFRGVSADNPIYKLFNMLGGGKLLDWVYDITHRGQQALGFFQDKGYSAAQAAGIVANLQAESGLRVGAENAGHRGISQLSPERQAEYKRRTGKEYADTSFEEQLENIDWELRNHPEYGRRLLLASKTAAESSQVFGQRFENYARPGQDPLEDAKRAQLATSIYNDIDIHINGGDTHQVKQAVTEAIKGGVGGPGTARQYANVAR